MPLLSITVNVNDNITGSWKAQDLSTRDLLADIAQALETTFVKMSYC